MRPLIVLGVTGSIAAVRSFDLCRELRRHGFDVQVVMSEWGTQLVGEDSMEFASGRKAITKLTGKIEHVKYFGKNGKASLLLIAPATANTISKIAMGIDDTPVTTFATVAIGSGKPVLLAPAMHKPMYEHPIVLENLKKLGGRGVRVIAPLEEDGKAKLASIEKIVFETQRAIAGSKFAGKKILVATGAISEKIDDVRAVTNRSTGELGTELALELMRQKGEVKIIGNNVQSQFLEFERAEFAQELEEKVLHELGSGYDYFFCPAAIPDFEVKKTAGKISSKKAIKLELEPRKKLIEISRKKFPKLKIVAFKALWGKNRKEIEKISKEFLKIGGLYAVCSTDLLEFANDSAKREMLFCAEKKSKWLMGTKAEIAHSIINFIYAAIDFSHRQ